MAETGDSGAWSRWWGTEGQHRQEATGESHRTGETEGKNRRRTGEKGEKEESRRKAGKEASHPREAKGESRRREGTGTDPRPATGALPRTGETGPGLQPGAWAWRSYPWSRRRS